ncbi:hypothetical protein COB57_01870 [Candidatus Peregrinibacteria bacterium]|nr:MAG: hypothetical protein COB57_01870 [Candidatus Peregrinibacteria bacterium]
MLILLSPAKTQKLSNKKRNTTSPIFLETAKKIQQDLQKKSTDTLQGLWKVSDKKFTKSMTYLQNFGKQTSAAIDTYTGTVFSQFQLESYSEKHIEYLKKHIAILSALYGYLRAFDSISLYRLDLMMPYIFQEKKLRDFWKPKIKDVIEKNPSNEILLLCSKEFQDLLPTQVEGKKIIEVQFFQITQDGKRKSMSVYTKQARGMMADFCIKNMITKSADLKNFHESGYMFLSDQSDETHFVFEKTL